MIGHADCNCHGLQKSGKTVDGIRVIQNTSTLFPHLLTEKSDLLVLESPLCPGW